MLGEIGVNRTGIPLGVLLYCDIGDTDEWAKGVMGVMVTVDSLKSA